MMVYVLGRLANHINERTAEVGDKVAPPATTVVGHLRRFGDVGGMSAVPPIATKSLHCGK